MIGNIRKVLLTMALTAQLFGANSAECADTFKEPQNYGEHHRTKTVRFAAEKIEGFDGESRRKDLDRACKNILDKMRDLHAELVQNHKLLMDNNREMQLLWAETYKTW
jgi:hypothetical protein